MHPDNKSAAGDKDAATLPFQALGNVKEILLTPGLRILHDNRWGSSAPAPGAPLGASRAQHYREDEGPPRPIALHLPAPLHEMPLADTCEEADHFGNSMGQWTTRVFRERAVPPDVGAPPKTSPPSPTLIDDEEADVSDGELNDEEKAEVARIE